MKRIPESELPATPEPLRAADLGRTREATPERLWAELRALQAAMPELMTHALTRLLDDELALAPDHIRGLVTSLLERAGERHGPFVLSVHPNDVPRLEGLLADVEVSPDPTLRPGGCVLRSATVELDGRVETRLERVLEVLRG